MVESFILKSNTLEAISKLLEEIKETDISSNGIALITHLLIEMHQESVKKALEGSSFNFSIISGQLKITFNSD